MIGRLRHPQWLGSRGYGSTIMKMVVWRVHRCLFGVVCLSLWIAIFMPMVAAKDGGTKAFQDYLSQAQKGSPISQYMVARAYELGEGIGQDDTKAAQWYAKASKGGFTEADVLLGLLEIEGRGVEHNVKKGLQRLFSAAKRGNILARYHLGCFHMNGQYVKKDLVQAYKWLFLAAHLPRTPESFQARKLIIELENIMSESQLKKARQDIKKRTPRQKIE